LNRLSHAGCSSMRHVTALQSFSAGSARCDPSTSIVGKLTSILSKSMDSLPHSRGRSWGNKRQISTKSRGKKEKNAVSWLTWQEQPFWREGAYGVSEISLDSEPALWEGFPCLRFHWWRCRFVRQSQGGRQKVVVVRLIRLKRPGDLREVAHTNCAGCSFFAGWQEPGPLLFWSSRFQEQSCSPELG